MGLGVAPITGAVNYRDQDLSGQHEKEFSTPIQANMKFIFNLVVYLALIVGEEALERKMP